MTANQERRHSREFEPPPWERDAFERFQREREEREKDAALDEALQVITSGGAQTPSAQPAHPEGQPESAPEGAEGPSEYQISSAEMEELMARLRTEEPRAVGHYRGLANTVMVFLLVGGVGFVGWSGVLLGKAGPNAGALQLMASLLVMVWGLMMIVFAVLLWRKHNV